MITDKIEEPCGVTAIVSLNDLIDTVLRLKLKALRKRDEKFFDIADDLEHQLKLLRDNNIIFEREELFL